MLLRKSVHYVCMHLFTSGPIYVFEILPVLASSPSHLFALPEHQVHEAAEESHGEADPGQDIGRAIRAFPKTGYMKGVFLSRVDGCCNHHT